MEAKALQLTALSTFAISRIIYQEIETEFRTSIYYSFEQQNVDIHINKAGLKTLLIYSYPSIISVWACLPSSYQAKSQQYCGPDGPTASIFYGI